MNSTQVLLGLGAHDFDAIGGLVEAAMQRRTTMTVFDEVGEPTGSADISEYVAAVARLDALSQIVRSDLIYQWQTVNTKRRDDGGSRLGAEAVKRALTALAFQDSLDDATFNIILAPVDAYLAG